MKKLLFLALVLVMVLTSCEKKSHQKTDEKPEVVLLDGVGKAVTLPITKLSYYGVDIEPLREMVAESSSKTFQSCIYKFTYQPTSVFYKVNEFKDTVVIIRACVYNKKGEKINIISTTVFSGYEIYEFFVDELKV